MSRDCIFCKIVARQIPAEIVFEDERILAFNDINPQAPVHILIIPKKHIERLSDLHPSDKDLMAEIIFKAKQLAEDKGIAERGYRLVINNNKDAGQAVFHLHFHLIGGRKLTWPPG
ncbi:MAG: histidine triad nucleotide-binding protein [Candidatus Omnitrophota bacterium]|nr:MAG: histidine triad nucleotide-binding protein [Candidatus Omnitrophota bacterium]